MRFGELLLFGGFAALANLSGGLLIIPARLFPRSEKYSKYLIALGVGFMLAVIFLEIMPKTLQLWTALQITAQNTSQLVKNDALHESYSFVFLLFLGGYLLLYIFEQITVPHFHITEEHDSSHTLLSPTTVYAATAGLLLHTFFDGVSLAAAAMTDFRAGILVFLAIFLHKIPEGFAVASLFVAAGKTTRFAVLMSGITGLVTLLGILCVVFLQNWIYFSVAYTLPVAAGVTFYVVGTELLPELKHQAGRNVFLAFFVCVGVALFFLLHQVLENFMPN